MTRSRRGHGRGGHGGGGGGGGGGHGGGDARWLVTYADLLTLLMVLFLVLWVISRIDLAKFEKFKSGLGDFGNAAAGPTTTDALAELGLGANLASSTTTTGVDGSGPAGGADGVLSAGELGQLQAGLEATIVAAGFGDVITVDVQERGLVISVTTDDVLFASGSGVLEPQASAVIDIVAGELADISNSVIVEGYTDKRALHRAGYDNWDLSVDRAVSVVKLLRDTYGLDPARLSATGYGDQHPVALGDDEASYARNRRVQIVVVAGEDTTTPTPTPTTPTTPTPSTAVAAPPDGETRAQG
jgi:chemotaxis protein MotB